MRTDLSKLVRILRLTSRVTRWGKTTAYTLHHVAGDKVFVDYSGKKIAIADGATGEIRVAEIFVAVLGASNFTYAEATWTAPSSTGHQRRSLPNPHNLTEFPPYQRETTSLPGRWRR